MFLLAIFSDVGFYTNLIRHILLSGTIVAGKQTCSNSYLKRLFTFLIHKPELLPILNRFHCYINRFIQNKTFETGFIVIETGLL